MAFTTIQGTVTRTMFNGKGAEVTETFQKRDGSEGKTRWACWFEAEHGLNEGDTIEVSGMHGDQVDEWTDREGGKRHSVKRSINKAKVRSGSGQNTTSSAQHHAHDASGADTWATPPTDTYNGSETPF